MGCDSGEKYFAPTLDGGVGADGRVANRACGVAGCVSGEKCFARTLVGGVGADGSGCEQVCGVAGCDLGEKCFAPTLVVGVGADWSGCEQGRCGCWFAIRAKKILAVHWVAHLAVVR